MPTSATLGVNCELAMVFNERSLKGKELAQGDQSARKRLSRLRNCLVGRRGRGELCLRLLLGPGELRFGVS
jgi:hypothetical protein